MRNLLVVFFAILLVTAAAIGFASAATKVSEFRQQNVRETGPIVGVVCGSTVTSFTLFQREVSTVVWDNGHVQVHMKDTVVHFDSGSRRVGQAQMEMKTVTGEGGLPLSFVLNIIFTCGGASATPGLLQQAILGLTVGEDGTLKQMHAHT